MGLMCTYSLYLYNFINILYINSYLIKIRGKNLLPALKKMKLYRKKRINIYKYNVIWALIKACTVSQLQKESPGFPCWSCG